MKIKLIHALAGISFSYRRGEVIEIDDAEAVRLINGGLAAPVKEEVLVETAEAPKPKVEKATKK